MKLICNECGHNSTKNINIWIFKNLICNECFSDNVSIFLGNVEILHKNSPKCHYPECGNFLPLPWIEKGNEETGLGSVPGRYIYDEQSESMDVINELTYKTTVNFHTTCLEHIGFPLPKNFYDKDKKISGIPSWYRKSQDSNLSSINLEDVPIFNEPHKIDNDATNWFSGKLRKCKYGHDTVIRKNSHTGDKFLGCSTYPKCNWTSKCKFGHDSVIRRNSHTGEFFLGCKEFPKCGWTESLTDRIMN